MLIALLAPLLWGSTYAVVSLYLTDYSPYWVAVWRALPAGLLLLLLHPHMPPLPWGKQFLLAFCNIAAFFALLFLAAFRLPGAVAGTLGATLPLVLMLLAWLQDGTRPSLKWLLLGLMGLAGVLLLLNPSANLDPVGVACAMLATVLDRPIQPLDAPLAGKRSAGADRLAIAAWGLDADPARLVASWPNAVTGSGQCAGIALVDPAQHRTGLLGLVVGIKAPRPGGDGHAGPHQSHDGCVAWGIDGG